MVDWYCARALAGDRPRQTRRLILLVSLLVNLGLLGFFKYGGFVLDNLVVLLGALGFDYRPAAPDLVLPVGISFYTFQTLSYTLDVYFRRARPGASKLDFALYVTFFPQLVAGPIVRATDFLPQCAAPRRATGRALGWGLFLMSLGLFEKVVLADSIFAPVADPVFDGGSPLGALDAWAGTLAFAGQIFCDFAGYSTCAIGAALCLGFALPDNFRFPYAAIGFSDFWRRWHVSLSTWLRDYLYVPLGGNRGGEIRTHVNLMLTMLIGGLWHGASWTFVVWGGIHGVYLAVERLLRRVRWPAGLSTAGARFVLGLVTFGLICVTWIFFRARTLDGALAVLAAALGAGPADARPFIATQLLAAAAVAMTGLLAVHWFMRDRRLEDVIGRLPVVAVTALWIFFWLALALAQGSGDAFIYFQF
jgi:alginate O-acetyltransferase complex protein AlgI